MNDLCRVAAPVRFLLLFLAFFSSACSAQVATPVATGNRPIIAFPAHNRTADPLLVSGASLIDRYALHRPEVGVGDVLAAEARFQLGERGFAVVGREAIETATGSRTPGSVKAAIELASHGGLDGLVLFMEIRQWEADAPTHPAFVIVGLSASLVDPASGKILWEANRRTAPVTTPGETSIETAYETAARKVVTEVLSSLVATASN